MHPQSSTFENIKSFSLLSHLSMGKDGRIFSSTFGIDRKCLQMLAMVKALFIYPFWSLWIINTLVSLGISKCAGLPRIDLIVDGQMEMLLSGPCCYHTYMYHLMSMWKFFWLVCFWFFFTIFYWNIIVFYWKIVTLQCCVSFCYTTWISHIYPYIPSVLSLPTTACPTPPL